MALAVSMEFLTLLGIVILACLFPSCMIDAVRERDEKLLIERKNKAGACFGALVFLLCLYLKG